MGKNKIVFAVFLVLLMGLAASFPAESFDEAPYRKQRMEMVDLTIRARGITDSKVLQAMETVPRHEFVEPSMQFLAYSDRPLPIGYGQTISQPYIVAVMTDYLKLKGHEKVLEVGTGSGYQAAVLAEIVKDVFTIEIIEPLGERAEERLARLGDTNVTVRVGDGYYGWEEEAPFDAIIVTAAATHIPPPLIDQLKPGGTMIIPVGPVFHIQYLMLIEKRQDGSIVQRNVMPVRFVPLTGDH